MGTQCDDWNKARRVWSCARISLPKTLDSSSKLYLSNLQTVVRGYSEAKSIAIRDRNPPIAFRDIAEISADLRAALEKLDDIALTRLAPLLPAPATAIAQIEQSLGVFEKALLQARQPRVPRKRPHELDNILVNMLADLYERTTGRKPSVTTVGSSNARKGRFIDFVKTFAKEFLPDEKFRFDGRAIQRLLKIRRKKPDQLKRPNTKSRN